MSNQYLKNFSYIFIPFSLEDTDKFYEFYNSLTLENGWEQVNDEIRYLHRYVSEKLTGRTDEEINAYHFRLNKEFAQKQKLYLDSKLYSTDTKKFNGQENINFEFLISDVQLFAFNTSVCILAFELRFKDDDPFKIASAQYYLRKITTEKIHLADQTEEKACESFVDISKKILQEPLKKFKIDFFFYAPSNSERANFLTYIDVPEKENYDKELYFLKWCYNEGFDFDNTCCEDGSENYVASSNTTWGISPSAAVCLVNRNGNNNGFIENVFQKNFQKQYLFTYILLLHQKYTMYLFLTKVSVGIKGNLVELEKYKSRLYEVETTYMFSHISEVPQYQRFYEKTKKAFSLDEMFRDVQEPLAQLAEIQKHVAEKEQRDYDYRINTALTTLSLLTVVSAITDSTGITSNLSWLIPPLLSKIIQITTLVAVIGLSIYMIARLISLRNKH